MIASLIDTLPEVIWVAQSHGREGYLILVHHLDVDISFVPEVITAAHKDLNSKYDHG